MASQSPARRSPRARRLIGSEFRTAIRPGASRGPIAAPPRNAQEAHEAIRPDRCRPQNPPDVAADLDRDQRRLYELIWKRTIASQMASALLEQVTVDITDPTERLRLRANGSVVIFDGFSGTLPGGIVTTPQRRRAKGPGCLRCGRGERLAPGPVVPRQHFTQPPAALQPKRASSKKLEELGIGRPSTYASILQVPARPDLRPAGETALRAGGSRAAGHPRFLTNFFETLCRIRLHRRSRESARRRVRAARTDWKEVLAQFSGGIFLPRSTAPRG